MSAAARRRRGGAGVVRAVLAAALFAGALAALLGAAGARPRILVGEPLPRVLAAAAAEKPDPAKAAVGGAEAAKPSAVDLGPAAPVTTAPAEDPLAAAVAADVQQALVAANPGRSAVVVVDADGRVLFDVGGTTPLLPASTAKLITAAAVLAAFGPDHTFATTVAATTPPDAAGVVAGDLVLVGGGDPTLVSDGFLAQQVDPERPSTPVAALADQLVAAGITAVRGRVVGDAGYLAGPSLAEGWPARYLDDLDATPITGLTVDRGLQLVPDGAGVRARAAADPALEAATALTAALTARGIAVAGPAASLPEGQRLAAAQALGRVDSPPVAALLRHMVQESDNHMADTLFRAAGRHGPGRGSFDDAAAALPALLADLELDWSVAAVRDGSGLSRATAVPPTLLALLDYRMTRSTLGPTWQDLMAVAGVSGTLEGRLTGTIAELRLRGKTGSLGDVRALSGSVVGPDGRTLHLAVVSDQLQPVDLDDARRLQDLVVLALTAELHGCALAAPPSPTGAPTPAPPPAGELPPLPAYAC